MLDLRLAYLLEHTGLDRAVDPPVTPMPFLHPVACDPQELDPTDTAGDFGLSLMDAT